MLPPFVFHETAGVLSEKVQVERCATVGSALARTSLCAIMPESSRSLLVTDLLGLLNDTSWDWIFGGNRACQRIGFWSLEALGC